MTILKSISAVNPELKDATISWLKEDLQHALDLIQMHRIALQDEKNATRTARTEARMVAMQCMDLISRGDYFMARAHLQTLFLTMEE